MSILFVGETWLGSSARSLREALMELTELQIDEVGDDQYFPRGTSLVVRLSNRLLRPWHRAALEDAITSRLAATRPDVLMVYKGRQVTADLLRSAQKAGVLTVNVFPDQSPHLHGAHLKSAIGVYDLVISTKPFHPRNWQSVYGYSNRCVCVPHGYDPTVHHWTEPAITHDFDVVLAASWREQYHALMMGLAEQLRGLALRVGIMGNGWQERAGAFPAGWQLVPPLWGRSYGEWVRRGRIVVAPVHRDITIGGVRQPGDEDTTRTYELAAMGCFFLHRRTPYAQTVYDELTEVPMWDDAAELAGLIRRYLPLDAERQLMARNAQRRAVPAYSIPSRAREVLAHVTSVMNGSERPVS